MSRIPSFKDLEVWRRAMQLVGRVYDLTRSYPPDERFGLIAETRKSARSVPANVAEGKTRSSEKEFRHFVSIASGSLGELLTQLLIAQQLGYLAKDTLAGTEQEIDEIGRMLRALARALELAAKA